MNIQASLILPCYNEAEHFEKSVWKIIHTLENSNLAWEILFIDDKSTDNTPQLIKSFINKKQAIPSRAFFHEVNQGRGATVSDGIHKARGAIVGYIDIDGEIAPHYIPLFVEAIENGFDVVCAWRIYQLHLENFFRYLTSITYVALEQKVLDVDFPDTEAGFKFFRRQKILPLLSQVKANHWFWDTEIMLRSQKAKLAVKFIPTVFLRRQDKKSTVKLLPDTIGYLKNLFRLRRELAHK